MVDGACYVGESPAPVIVGPSALQQGRLLE